MVQRLRYQCFSLHSVNWLQKCAKQEQMYTLVPYRCAEPSMQFLINATQIWYKDGNLDVGTSFTPG
jgi:hypothetical protein